MAVMSQYCVKGDMATEIKIDYSLKILTVGSIESCEMVSAVGMVPVWDFLD